MYDPRVLQTGHAPTPFTAEEIRAGCPPGRMITARTETAGEPDRVDLTVFVETDKEGALIESNGTPHRVTWRDLQSQASFPADMTTISEEMVEGPLGQMECLSYRVTTGHTASIFWFAKDRPGMPVLFLTESNGALLSTTLVVADEIMDPGDI